MSTLFKKIQKTHKDFSVGGLLAAATKVLRDNPGLVTKEQTTAMIAMESEDSPSMQAAQNSVEKLHVALEGIFQAHTPEGYKPTASQLKAGVIAAMAGGDIQGFIRHQPKQEVSTENFQVMPAVGGDQTYTRMSEALEAYDERANTGVVPYSVAYNMVASRQDEFGEAFYPTTTIDPSQFGYAITVRVINVFDEVRRQISGAVDDFKKKNILQAVIDPSILKNDQTNLVPIYRDESAANFVLTSQVAPYAATVEGETVTTSALKMGASFSLLGLSQTDALLETGLLDSTDAIDPALSLKNIYVQIVSADGNTKEVLKFPVKNLATSNFAAATQGNYRAMTLNFQTTTLLVNDTIKKYDGTPGGATSTLLSGLVSAHANVRLGVNIFGSVNTEIATTTLNASPVNVSQVYDAAGSYDPAVSGTGLTMATLFANATVIGYDLDARRTNTNRRQRGQLLDTTYFTQLFSCALRSPITVPRPQTAGDMNDASDLTALVTTTRIRTSNAAVDELFVTSALLKQYVSAQDSLQTMPEILNVARWLVKPYYAYKAVDVAASIDSIKSGDRIEDLAALLRNVMRDMVYTAYQKSGYKAAADGLSGGIAPPPTVIIGTDQVLGRYMQLAGDFRTLGDFNFKIVTTQNQLMYGKIFMSFGQFEGEEGVPNPLHFGTMLYKPELTLALPTHRNGANSKEISVQPCFQHVTNLPILMEIDVTNLSAVVTGKSQINFHTV